MEKQFYWSDFGYKQDAQKVGEFIASLEKRFNRVDATLLVKHSEDPKSPTHSMFIWDDSEAAKRYREVQARNIIGALRVTINELPIKRQRAFVHVRKVGEQDGLYKSIEEAMKNEDDMQYLINVCLRDLRSVQSKLKKFQQLAKYADKLQLVINELDQAV